MTNDALARQYRRHSSAGYHLLTIFTLMLFGASLSRPTQTTAASQF